MFYSMLDAFRELKEDHNAFQYKCWCIIYGTNKSHGVYIKDINSDWTWSGDFSTEEEAMEYIDTHEEELKQKRDAELKRR